MKTVTPKDLKPRTRGDALLKRLMEDSMTCSNCNLLFSAPMEKLSIEATGVCLSCDHVEAEKYE